MVFKSFSLPYTIINFLFASLKLLLILKMLTETLLRIPFSLIGRCYLVLTYHGLQGNAQELWSADFTGKNPKGKEGNRRARCTQKFVWKVRFSCCVMSRLTETLFVTLPWMTGVFLHVPNCDVKYRDFFLHLSQLYFTTTVCIAEIKHFVPLLWGSI